MTLPLVLCLITFIDSALSLSCYECIRENLPGQADPLFYNYDYFGDHSLLDSSCLQDTKPCDEGDEDGKMKCASVTLGPDHMIGNVSIDSVDRLFCMYVENYLSEEEVEEEMCMHEGAEVGPQCKVTANCGEDGCNYDAPMPHACSACELPADDFCQGSHFIDTVQSKCQLVNCTDGVNQCFTKIDQDSCKVIFGCKPPDLADCPSSSCSVCDREECTLDTSILCEPGNGCIEEPPHECLSCTHQACSSDPTEVCEYKNCSTGVKECYSQLDSCSITRGCKPPDLKCDDGSTTCSVCKENEMCSLDTDSHCKSGGACDKFISCNTCNPTLSHIDFDSWTDYAKENCSKQVTCKKDIQKCAILEKNDCNFIVGCDENEKTEDKHGTFLNLIDLLRLLGELYEKKKDVIEKCKNQSESDPAIKHVTSGPTCKGGKCDNSNSFLSFYLCSIISLNYFIPMLY